MRDQLGVVAVLALMGCIGALAWWLALRDEPQADVAPLAAFPLALGGWEGRELPLEQAVESMLDADFNLQRAYQRPEGDLAWLYIGYYSTRRGGTPEHLPRVCYVSGGWEILEHRPAKLGHDGKLPANEMVVAQGGSLRLVHYWFRSYRKTGILDIPGLRLDHAIGRLLDRRGDGALVRVSAPIPLGGRDAVRRRLAGFAGQVDSLLGEYWPRETLAATP